LSFKAEVIFKIRFEEFEFLSMSLD